MRNPALAKAYRKSKILTKYYIAREMGFSACPSVSNLA